jgi:hypothetical protein
MQQAPDYIYRKGKYRYFRHPGGALTPLPSCATREQEARAAFQDVYQPLLRAVQGTNNPPAPTPVEPRPARPAKAEPGSISWFIERYIASKNFTKLSASTRKAYLIQFDLMRDQCGIAMLHDLSPQGVDRYSKKIADLRSASIADVHTTLFANLWEFAKGFEEFERGDKADPTIGRTRHYAHDGEGHLAWPDEVIDKFDGWAEPHLRQYRMALQYTGQRGVDVVKMKWSDFDGELIAVRQQKTGEQIWLACPAPLLKMLKAMPRKSAFIFTNMWGKPYASAASLSNSITNHLEKIGHSNYSMHGLRKNAGMELAMAGCTVPEIMAVLGHRSPKMAIFYVQQADKKRLGRTATIKWNIYTNERGADRERRANGQAA